MREEWPDGVPELESLLEREGHAPVPEPGPDLVSRTLRRIHHWVLVGDLLRLATFEGLWKKRHRREGDAPDRKERQDS